MKNQTQLPTKVLKVEGTEIIINTYESDETVKLAAAKALAKEIQTQIENRIPILLMLSGGSALQVTETLANILNTKTYHNNLLTVSVVDERVVQGEDNNYQSLQKSLFGKWAKNNNVYWIDTGVKNSEDVGNVEKHAEKFGKDLHTWKRKNSQGQIIALLGVGVDGHTAGILPFEENPALSLEEWNWVVGYNIENYSSEPDKINPHHFRSTTTPNFIINSVDTVLVYMVGNEKKNALKGIVTNEGDIKKTPARIFRERQKLTRIFTDLHLSFVVF